MEGWCMSLNWKLYIALYHLCSTGPGFSNAWELCITIQIHLSTSWFLTLVILNKFMILMTLWYCRIYPGSYKLCCLLPMLHKQVAFLSSLFFQVGNNYMRFLSIHLLFLFNIYGIEGLIWQNSCFQLRLRCCGWLVCSQI